MNSKDLRKKRVRGKITGTGNMPRLSVRASLGHIYAQIINDTNGKTLCAASDMKIKEKITKIEKAKKVGAQIAEEAKIAGIKKVVFDRGASLYHGRVKAVAEAAREKGLEF